MKRATALGGSRHSDDPEVHAHAAAARARKRADAAAIGIDAALIDRLVEQFYARVRADEQLGPIFARHITDWGPHLAQMKRFWASILIGGGDYSGQPMRKHLAISGLTREDFLVWLGLFDETLADISATAAAREQIHTRARMIANSLLNGIAIHHHGQLGLPPEQAV